MYKLDVSLPKAPVLPGTLFPMSQSIIFARMNKYLLSVVCVLLFSQQSIYATANAVCQDITVDLTNTMNGTATITPNDVDGGSTGDTITLSLDVNTFFACTDFGSNTVVLTVDDTDSSTSSCTADVFVDVDLTPVLGCRDATVAFADTAVTIATTDVDALGMETLTINITTDNFPEETSFELTNGSGTVIFEQPQGSFNQDATLFTFQVDIPCDDDYTFTIFDAFGDGMCCGLFGDGGYEVILNGVIVASGGDFNSSQSTTFNIAPCNGGYDNCGILTWSLDFDTFTCDHFGNNTVTLTGQDAEGNTGSCTAIVTVLDGTQAAQCQAATVYLDTAGTAQVTPEMVNATVLDACDSLSLNITEITDCQASATVNLTVHSNTGGNTTSCNAVVTALDTVPPTIICNDISVELNGAGAASISATDVAPFGLQTVTINITTDEFPEETSFELTDASGNILFEETNFNQLSTLFTFQIDVICSGTYTFTIFDAFGDGICCGVDDDAGRAGSCFDFAGTGWNSTSD